MATVFPTFAVPPQFLGVGRRESDAVISIAGIPLDIGTTNRSGARFGPQAIRLASRMLVDGAHPTAWINVSESMLSDMGDFHIALGDIPASLKAIEEQAAAVDHLVALGGEHSITLALLRALVRHKGPLALIDFDAHVDTWPDNFGQPYSHGSVFYHAIEERLIDPRRMIQIGIRSPVQRGVFDWTLERSVTIITAEEVHEQGPKAAVERIHSIVGEAPCYLSFDVDALDPAFAPGTGTPEVGGFSSYQMLQLLRGLRGLNIVGGDLVEVSPPFDHSNITAILASNLVFEYLSLLALNKLAE